VVPHTFKTIPKHAMVETERENTPMLTTKSPEFIAWLAACQNVVDEHRNARFPTLPREVLTAEDLGKFIRIWAGDTPDSNGKTSGRHSWGFVAKLDFDTNKALGPVKRGDIHKCATWKAPAKHARGNIQDANKGLAMVGPYGIGYLR